MDCKGFVIEAPRCEICFRLNKKKINCYFSLKPKLMVETEIAVFAEFAENYICNVEYV